MEWVKDNQGFCSEYLKALNQQSQSIPSVVSGYNVVSRDCALDSWGLCSGQGPLPCSHSLTSSPPEHLYFKHCNCCFYLLFFISVLQSQKCVRSRKGNTIQESCQKHQQWVLFYDSPDVIQCFYRSPTLETVEQYNSSRRAILFFSYSFNKRTTHVCYHLSLLHPTNMPLDWSLIR